MKYLAAYDISNDKKIYRVSKILMKNGIRIQKSVFECDISFNYANDLYNEITKILDEKDKFYIIPVRDEFISIGKCSKMISGIF